MADTSKKKKYVSLKTSIPQHNIINFAYAKFWCRRFSTAERLRFYKKLASLLRNRFSLVDALDRIYAIASEDGKNTGEVMAIAIATWARKLQNGESFSQALDGWAPVEERLLLSVGDTSYMDRALDNVIEVVEGSNRLTGPLVSALSYPAFLFIASIFVIYGIGAFIVPPMVDAAPNVKWTGTAASLVGLGNWVGKYWYMLVVFVISFFLFVTFSMTMINGRIRAALDNAPPWSLVKIMNGASFLLALAALVKAGTPVSQALRIMRNDSNKYLQIRIDDALRYINNGMNIGDALYESGYKFPDKEIIGDLRVYAELDNFAESLDAIAHEWLRDAEAMILQRAGMLNTFAILFVSGIIAWAVFGTYELQNQLVAAMDLNR